jgi:hypothetical protein
LQIRGDVYQSSITQLKIKKIQQVFNFGLTSENSPVVELIFLEKRSFHDPIEFGNALINLTMILWVYCLSDSVFVGKNHSVEESLLVNLKI